jgi:ATP-dependent Clp protease protease subunit
MIAFFGILDTMQFIRAPISTICVGQACSAAALLLAPGGPGRRLAQPNPRELIHQHHGGAQAQSSDLEIQIRESVELRDRMVDVLVERTGQSRERILADIDRDFILRGSDAVVYGLIYDVISTRELRPAPALAAPGYSRPVAPREPAEVSA